MIYRLPEDDYWFPNPLSIPPEYREEDGCVAIGGDLRPERLLEAYAQGIFPWNDFRIEEHLWYCPMQRFVIFPDRIHVSHSMRNYINRRIYQVSIDNNFEDVIQGCARQRIHLPGAWLGPEMIQAYTRLHQMGYAHSVEVWKDGELVGGLYGVAINKAFMGESMFSTAPGASKFALLHLCNVMRQNGGVFIDCQFETPHLKAMGGTFISYTEYMDLLWS